MSSRTLNVATRRELLTLGCAFGAAGWPLSGFGRGQVSGAAPNLAPDLSQQQVVIEPLITAHDPIEPREPYEPPEPLEPLERLGPTPKDLNGEFLQVQTSPNARAQQAAPGARSRAWDRPTAPSPRTSVPTSSQTSLPPPHTPAAHRARSGQPLPTPPTAYVVTAQNWQVPAWLLFGVALQESQMLFGGETLPYPWTLDVAGSAQRHSSFGQALQALRAYLARGVTNIDCGPMQVNWRAHHTLLKSPTNALNPYYNLAVGAWLLRKGYAQTSSWPMAVGLYHTGSFNNGSRRMRAVNYVAGVSKRLSRHGLTLAEAASLTQGGHYG